MSPPTASIPPSRAIPEVFSAAGAARLWRKLQEHQVDLACNAMAFDLFLALIPLLAIAGWVSALALQESAEALRSLALLLRVAPDEVQSLARTHFARFAGGVAPIGLVWSLWLSSSAFSTLISVLETAARTPKRRWWERRLLAVGCAVGAILGVSLLLAVNTWTLGGPLELIHVMLPARELDLPLGRVVVLFGSILVAIAMLAAFFLIAIRRPGVPRRIWPGASVAVALGGSVSAVFAYYAHTLARFALFYGSIAAVAVTLVWLWLLCAALLLGAEVNIQLEGG